MFWKRLKQMWEEHEQKVATEELRREAADAEGRPAPHTGGALFDEPFEPTVNVPGDDAPSERRARN